MFRTRKCQEVERQVMNKIFNPLENIDKYIQMCIRDRLLSGKKIRQIFHFLFFITPVEDWPAAQGSVRRADNACGCTDSG